VSIKIISDIHGAFPALAEQLDPDDIAILLGDYVNLIDFQTLEGILADVYSREEVAEALSIFGKGTSALREAAKKRIRDIMGSDPAKAARIGELVLESYKELFASIPCRAYMIYGNTDNPHMVRNLADGNVEIIETGVVEIEGQRFGFISGSPHGPWTVGLPGEMNIEEYDRRVRDLGPVEVLCTHYPPAVPALTFDTCADRDEAGSASLLEYIEEHSPTYHYFGHVHHPRVTSERLGSTCLVNVGFFREHRTAVVHPASCGPT